MPKIRKPPTETSDFGIPARISHNAKKFYGSRLYKGVALEKNARQGEIPLPEACRNTIFCKSSEKMDDLPDHSIHLMVTSPPYNASKQYDEDLTLEEYRAFLKRIWQETYRVLAPGGRACINIANLGRRPYLPLHQMMIEDMLAIGFLMRGEIIWNKAASASTSTAWGSWKSASNPVLRDVHEYILIFCKDSFTRKKGERENSIGKEEFLEWTKSVWTFPAVSARKIGHPAPFPEELPHRLIQLYTFKSDIVLDPFAGSGSTCLAAARDGRHYVGYEINAEYVELAKRRIMGLGDSLEKDIINKRES